MSLLFSIVPLLQVRLVKPSLLLRDEDAPGAARLDRAVAATVLVSAGAGRRSRRGRRRRCASGSSCALGFAVLAVVLHAGRRGCWCALLAPLANARSFPLRHAVLHLSRPGNQTRVILLAVGLGAFFIVGVRSLQASLLDEFSIQVDRDRPTCSCSTSSASQADGVRAFLARSGATAPARRS